MRPQSNREFQTMVQEAQTLAGSRLQDVIEAGSRLALHFWSPEKKDQIWILDMKPADPCFLPWPLLGKSKKKSPVGLFLRAHFKGRYLQKLIWQKDLGRVLLFDFGDGFVMEVRLFRGGANILLQSPDKKISWAKPQALKPMTWQEDTSEGRALEEMARERFGQGTGSKGQGGDPEALRKNKIKKIQVALEKARQDLLEKQNAPWLAMAQRLQTHQNLEVPAEWLGQIDRSLSVAQNMDHFFAKAKQNKLKIQRVERRLNELEQELQAVAQMSADELVAQQKRTALNPGTKPLAFKGRNLRLQSGHQLLIGRNARENLQAIRISSPWDYWLHLRDYPGAHGVLRRSKGENITDQVFSVAIEHLISESFRGKSQGKVGEKFDVLVAELRFVKPIKGDKLGRVNYVNERVIHQVFRPSI